VLTEVIGKNRIMRTTDNDDKQVSNKRLGNYLCNRRVISLVENNIVVVTKKDTHHWLKRQPYTTVKLRIKKKLSVHHNTQT